MNRHYRKTIMAGNWKMNKTILDAKGFIAALRGTAGAAKNCEVVLCLPFTHLPAAVKAAKGSRVDIGAQNCHWEDAGAFTGEVSCKVLAELGVKYVIIGHSERRAMFGETDATVALKVRAALAVGLRPIVCVGETLDIRKAGAALEYVAFQVKAALSAAPSDALRRIVIAYEPVWAIGTGQTATAEQAGEMGAEIRRVLRGMYGARAARSVSILYGGSMNPDNAADLLAKPDVDGGLIGGASLDVARFTALVEAASV